MNKEKSKRIPKKALIIAALTFLMTYGFFQFGYPYHLMRREQLDLFLFDGDYISQTYVGKAWLARFISDFFEQFFILPVAGPAIVALLLTAIGIVTYRICRKYIAKWPSLLIAAAIFGWSFMRETGNLYSTRYTIVVLGYLALILGALQFKKHVFKIAALIPMLCFGWWSLGSPYHENYGKAWGTPKFDYERLIGLDAEAARENWDKVCKLSEKDLYMKEASYFFNLAHAMKGDIGERLLEHSQGNPYDLLLRISSEQSVFTNSIAGEAWYHLGNMSMAEQSAITTLQASPNHTGARFIKRLANISLARGNEIAANKYLGLLSKTLFYSRWANGMMHGHRNEATESQILEARKKLDDVDFVHLGDMPRAVLKGLLDADPENTLAQNYLLCYDLMRYDLEQFAEDYNLNKIDARLYHEAILIWLSAKGNLTIETAEEYGASASDITRMNSFGRNPERYRNTYWFYYLQALNRTEQ